MLLVGTFAVIIALAAAYAADPFAGPKYRGEPSDHFDGSRFFNPGERPRPGFKGFLRWQFQSKRGPWRRFTDTPCGPAPPPRVEGCGLRVTFINHSTTLIQTAGINILTDPVWSKRVGPVSWAGAVRRRAPGLRMEDLPPIDVVLLSHNHYDHFDLPTLRRLVAAHSPRFVTPLGVKALVESRRLGRAIELDWWSEAPLPGGLRVTCVPARHFSMRGLRDHDNTLWCGYVLDGPAGRVYFAGDTASGSHFAEIARRFAPLRLALLPIGAYRPEWFMSAAHVSPRQSLEAALELKAETSVAIHFGTFALADDGEFEPAAELQRCLDSLPPPAPRFWVLEFGEGRDVPELSRTMAVRAADS